jgi:hypothetical protein
MFALKEWFTMIKPICVPMGGYTAIAHISKETVALFQAATDEHWGVDCSRIMEAISVYDFNRHFQIARATAFTCDCLLTANIGGAFAEKTGNIEHCVEINDRKYRSMESYIRAAPAPGMDVILFLQCRGYFLGVEAHHQHLQPRHGITGLLKYAGINNTQQAEEGYRSSAEWANFHVFSNSSADGLTHMFHEHSVVAMIRAVLTFTVGKRDVELGWLDDLPPADATTMYDTCLFGIVYTTVRVLIAEVFEQQGRHAEAIRFAQTDLQDYHNLNVPSKVRAGRVLGRCHAALGQHMLSVSAFDAAIDLAHSRKLLLSEALAVRGQASAGANGPGGSGLHWDESTGKQRLVEVMSRMQGPREALEKVLLLPK